MDIWHSKDVCVISCDNISCYWQYGVDYQHTRPQKEESVKCICIYYGVIILELQMIKTTISMIIVFLGASIFLTNNAFAETLLMSDDPDSPYVNFTIKDDGNTSNLNSQLAVLQQIMCKLNVENGAPELNNDLNCLP